MSTTAIPTKPWAKSPRDRIIGFSFFFAAIAFSYFFVAATEMKGKLAYAFIFFLAYALISSTFSFINRGRQAAKDAFVSALVALGAVVTVVPIVSILATVLQKGVPGLHFGILSNDMSMATPTDPIPTGGLSPW
jgi:phosphate transport system permease protein